MEIAGLTLRQPETGYRFSLDPFLLADFARPRPRERIIDLGAGAGVIALLIARRHPGVRVVALELQPELARHARENAAANGLDGRCHVACADLRREPSLFPAGHFHRVVANPPYQAPRSGRSAPDPGRALARQELTFTIEDLARTASALLRFGGTLDLIHLAERIPELFRVVAEFGLEPKTLRMVAPFPDAAPRLCLVSARKGGRPGLAVLPQLAVHEKPGIYAAETAAILAGRPARAGHGIPG